MKYRNKRTQAVITTACEIYGGDWEKVEEIQPMKTTYDPEAETKTAKKSETKPAAKKAAGTKSAAKKKS